MSRKLAVRAAIIPGFFLVWLAAAGPARAGFVFQVTVNTSSLNTPGNGGGFVDFQFNAGDSADFATAIISNFSPAAILNGLPVLTGDASGDLNPPDQLTLDNGSGQSLFNDAFQALTPFSDQINFTVTLSGPAIITPSQSVPGGPTLSDTTFFFSLYGPDGVTPLLTTNPNGDSVLKINIEAGTGQVTTTTFPATPGGSSVITVQEQAPEFSTPAPSSLVLGLLGICILAPFVRRLLPTRRLAVNDS